MVKLNPLTSQAVDLINELDPDKKTYEWANKCLTSLRLYWRPLKNVTQGIDNKSIMYSMQELQNVRDSFDDEDFKKNIKFTPLPILEPLVNSVVEDMCKNPPRAEIRAEDPTAVNEKKQDIDRLKNRKIIEGDRTELQSRVGMPPYKMPYDKFNGNVEEFDDMGLDERDPDDVNFYQKNYQRLWYEIGGQSLINNVLKTNQFDKSTIRKLVKDVFWAKCVCAQTYVDQMTGEIKYKYIDPQICKGIFGTSNDGKDDVCRGWEDSVTVGEFLALTGNSFTDEWEKNWKSLLWGINYCNNMKFTGFIRGGVTYDCCGDPQWMDRIGCGGVEVSNALDWSMAYMYKVFVGYIEFPTWEATSTKLLNIKDPSYLEYVPYSYELKKKKIKEGYDKKSNLQQQWYCSYYLATSAASQYLYKFQKVYFQRITGANDEYSNGTLCYYQEEGKSAVEIAKTYIQTANFTYYRMLWVIYKAKPDADEYVYEELLQLAQNTQRQFAQNGTAGAVKGLDQIMKDTIQTMRQKHVRIRTYPRIDGKPVQNIYPIEKKGSGGLDPIAISMQAVTMWAEQQIAQKIGINPMRLGQNPPPRESTDSEQATINASFVTTGYMYRMIQYLKEHLAIVTLNYAQDIIKYKDSAPYKWIQTILGNESFEALKSIEDFAPHRYGIYVDDYNTESDKQSLKQAADIALQQKTIDIIQWGIITQTTNPKLGFKILAHLQLKTKKKERRQAVQDQEIQNAMAKNVHAMKMEEMEFDRGTKMGVAEWEYRAIVDSAKIQAGAKVEVKQLQNEAEPVKQQAKADSDIQVEKSKKDLENQSAFTA